MSNDSNDADITKEVPFVGFMCMKIYLGVEIHQNVDPPSNVAITGMLICNAMQGYGLIAIQNDVRPNYLQFNTFVQINYIYNLI